MTINIKLIDNSTLFVILAVIWVFELLLLNWDFKWNPCAFFFFCRQEMYPPKVAEFAFLTDGACTDKEILDLELVLLKVRALHMFYEINVSVDV